MKKQGKKQKPQKSKHKGSPSRAKSSTHDAKGSLAAIARATAVKSIAARTIELPANPRSHAKVAVNSTPLYAFDDRTAMMLTLLPFFIVAFGIGTSQVWRGPQQATYPTAHYAPPPAVVEPFARPSTKVALEQPVVTAVPPAKTPQVEAVQNVPAEIVPTLGTWPVVVAHGPDTSINRDAGPSQVALSSDAPKTVLAALEPAPAVAPMQAAPPAVAAIETPAKPDVVALLVPETTAPAAGPVTAPIEKPAVPETSCVREPVVQRTPAFFLGDSAAIGSASIDPVSFGRALATAAREQLDDFTVYTDKYQTLKYPMGDLPAFYGVCTDVIVRAYRELGLDLQQKVHESKIGGGDTNIDHRRVTTLQKFFAKYGDELPITEFGEDYMPGDIVSYWRPQNAHSRTHIAIVSDVVGPSGQWMIIHNRGWGPQIEDGLFVDEITGHYRYSGSKSPPRSVPTPAVVSTAKQAKPVTQTGTLPAQVKKVKRAAVSQAPGFQPAKGGSFKPSKL